MEPSTEERIPLPSGRTVAIPKATPIFKLWTGEKIADDYGGKIILDFDGKPEFAELGVLRVFEQAGWQGFWVDTFHRKYRTRYWPANSVEPSEAQASLLNRIYKAAGSRKGCWDVGCWKGSACIFAESKQRTKGHKDEIQDTQRRWLEAALECGLPLESFLVVEWSL
ncbi:MAG: hypothetical protein ABSG14_09680 [Verrucomicrobiia bacterium]